jgi:hypothetical protein
VLDNTYSGGSATDAKLKAVLLKAEQMGTSIAEAFSAFDKVIIPFFCFLCKV